MSESTSAPLATATVCRIVLLNIGGCSSISGSGYIVTKPAKRYKEAIVMIEEEMPDLLLLDVKFWGKLDGIEVARTVQKVFAIPHIILTANTDFETIPRAKEVTPVAFLAKPVTRPQLHAAIEIALSAYTDHKGKIPSEARPIDTASIFMKQRGNFHRVAFSEVFYAESRDNYVLLMLDKGEIAFIHSTLAECLKLAPKFLNVQHSYAVAPDKVSNVLTDEVRIAILRPTALPFYRL